MNRFDSTFMSFAFLSAFTACAESDGLAPGAVEGADPQSQAGSGSGTQLAGLPAANSAGMGSMATGSAAAGGSGMDVMQIGLGASNDGSVGSPESCARQQVESKVLPVNLAFAFDVSGSMGEHDFPWHDPVLKWDPVVAATKSFFEDPASEGLSASMTLFPAHEYECDDATYATPDIPMTALPSRAFGRLLDAQSLISGTPTLHVVRGVIDFVQNRMASQPGRYRIVLVTDGYPQGCPDASIASVVQEVSAVAATIPTYVIGVKNPPLPDAPDTVSSLAEIARAGGTDEAYIIDTGNPAKTAADFKATIDAIRGHSIACDVPIPAPPDGSHFDKEKVAVSFTAEGAATSLSYDQSCAGPNGWQYDDTAHPTQIRLCRDGCSAIQAASDVKVNVEFTCEPVLVIPR